MKATLSRLLAQLDVRLTPLARLLPEPVKAPLRRLARPAAVESDVVAVAPATEQDEAAVAAPVEEITPAEVQTAPAAAEEAAPADPAAAPTDDAPGDVPDDAPDAPSQDAELDYAARLRQEQAIFADQVDVNALPDIFHYWSHTYLRPRLQHFGCNNPDEFFANALAQALQQSESRPARFVSLGAGNCDTEIRVAGLLRARGLHDFVLECLDINPVMLERGRREAQEQGLAAQVVAASGDFNDWQPTRRYDAVMANQSLHHVCNLEGLFDAVAAALQPPGLFVISDMIGRNGHQRWPEAAAIVREFWAELPPHYRYHRQLQCQWDEFVDFDCSGEGFEGIRAQDILPLLMQRFGFESFCAFGNVIDPFIDRGFGGHFDADSVADRTLIDRIHARDEAEIAAGTVKPTHLMAVMRRLPYTGPTRTWQALTPQHCLRAPG